MKRLGLFGGTFDPIHIGHLIIAEEARFHFQLDSVVFIPARVSPLKPQGASASAPHRLRMVELAIADNPHFCVSALDIERQGPSYTVDTLRAILAASEAQTQWFFILGADSLSSLTHWRSPQDLLRLTRLIAVSRPACPVDMDALERELPGIGRATDFLDTVHLGISSTDIRARARQGLPIRYQVCAQVEEYIRVHGLYLEGGEATPRRPGPCC